MCEIRKILYLSLKEEPFEVMVSGEKTNEFRTPSEWILSRVKGKEYTHVKFTNGYGAKRPYFICEFGCFSESPVKAKLVYSNGLEVIVEPGDIIITFGKIVETGNLK